MANCVEAIIYTWSRFGKAWRSGVFRTGGQLSPRCTSDISTAELLTLV